MAQKLALSFKRIAIGKAEKNVTTFITIAVVVVVFSLVACRSLYSQFRYQNRVIVAKQQAQKQLRSNLSAVSTLAQSYKAFDDAPESIIGTADKNSKIILDALPSKYDFPALATSLEKLLAGYANVSIAGNDDEVAQQNAAGSTLVEIPFTLGVGGPYSSLQSLLDEFDRSIRPIHILKLSLAGSEKTMTMNLSAKTYYQSEKTLEITTKEIK